MIEILRKLYPEKMSEFSDILHQQYFYNYNINDVGVEDLLFYPNIIISVYKEYTNFMIVVGNMSSRSIFEKRLMYFLTIDMKYIYETVLYAVWE